MPVSILDRHSVCCGYRAATCDELDPDVVGVMVALEIEIDRGRADLAAPMVNLPTKISYRIVIQEHEVGGPSAERAFDAFPTLLEVPGRGIIRGGAAASAVRGQAPAARCSLRVGVRVRWLNEAADEELFDVNSSSDC